MRDNADGMWTNNFSKYELAVLHYMKRTIVLTLIKFAVLWVLFWMLGLGQEYLVSVGVLTSTRSFLGGLHFNGFWSCLIFSTMFFAVVLTLQYLVPLTPQLQILILLICLAVSRRVGPVISANRPKYSSLQKRRFLYIGLFVILAYCIILAFCETRFSDIIAYTVACQTIQLVWGKVKGGNVQ